MPEWFALWFHAQREPSVIGDAEVTDAVWMAVRALEVLVPYERWHQGESTFLLKEIWATLRMNGR